MRVLLSGGLKTENIVNGIYSQFTANGDEFVVVRYLDEIEEIFSRGDYFDKAVICEQSITRDNSITDEFELRSRVNDFALKMQRNTRKFNFVFLTQTPAMANIVHEEIFPIADTSVVVMKPPMYDAQFFVTLIVTDIRQLPSNIVYVPALIIPDTKPEDEDLDMLNFNPDTETKPFVKVTGITSLTDEDIDIDGITPIIQSEDLPFDGNSEAVNTFDEQLGSDMIFGEQNQGQSDTPEYIQGFDQDTSVVIEKQVEEDYTPTQTEFTRVVNPSEDNNIYTGNLDNIPGFDIEPEMYPTPNAFSNDLYGNPTQGNAFGNYDETSSQNAFGGYGEVPNAFGNDMYDNPSTGSAFGDDTYGNPSADNFGPALYGGNDQVSAFGEDYDNTDMQPSTETDYDNMVDSAFKNDYGQDNDSMELGANTNLGLGANVTLAAAALTGAAALQNELGQLTAAEPLMVGNPSMNINQPPAVNNPKKRGLLGRFGKNNNQSYQAPAQQQQQQTRNDGRLNVAAIKESLRPFAERGNSIVVTGCGGCGTSVIAYNLANIVSQLGYTVLLVDMDTEGRTQSYISKDNYESMEPDGANLMSAVNSSTGINAHVSVVKTGFRLLTMGLGSDTAPVQDILQREKISRFSNLCKTANNFIIYDVPFSSATNYLADLTYMSDNLVLTIDASNWGVTKTMLNMCNISNDEMLDTMFSRSQIVFNKYRNLNKVLGRKVKTGVDIAKVMDQKVLELIGEDAGFHFEDLHIAGIINDDPDFETSWFDTVQYSDTRKGQEIFLGLLERIVLKK